MRVTANKIFKLNTFPVNPLISESKNEIACYKTLDGRVEFNFTLISEDMYKCTVEIGNVSVEDSGPWWMMMGNENDEWNGWQESEQGFVISITEAPPISGPIEADPKIPVNRGI